MQALRGRSRVTLSVFCIASSNGFETAGQGHHAARAGSIFRAAAQPRRKPGQPADDLTTEKEGEAHNDAKPNKKSGRELKLRALPPDHCEAADARQECDDTCGGNHQQNID